MNFEDLRRKTESKVRRDIADFETILAHVRTGSTEALRLRRTYTTLLAGRRDMLARLQAARE